MSNKPPLPKGFDYKKAITDYLRELGEVIKKSINDKWNVDDKWKVDFYTQVLIVLTVNKFYEFFEFIKQQFQLINRLLM